MIIDSVTTCEIMTSEKDDQTSSETAERWSADRGLEDRGADAG